MPITQEIKIAEISHTMTSVTGRASLRSVSQKSRLRGQRIVVCLSVGLAEIL